MNILYNYKQRKETTSNWQTISNPSITCWCAIIKCYIFEALCAHLWLYKANIDVNIQGLHHAIQMTQSCSQDWLADKVIASATNGLLIT